MDGAVRLTVDEGAAPCGDAGAAHPRLGDGAAAMTVNGAPVPLDPAPGYARITRKLARAAIGSS